MKSCRKPSCAWSEIARGSLQSRIRQPTFLRSARNEALRFLARRGQEARRQASAAELFLEAASDDASRRDLAELVARGLDGLSSLEREVVELKIYGGLTFREIAQVIEAPLQTAASRYRKRGWNA